MTRIPAGYEKTHALCHSAYAWHGGQASRVYRIACRLHHRLRREGMSRPLDTLPTVTPEFLRWEADWDQVMRRG